MPFNSANPIAQISTVSQRFPQFGGPRRLRLLNGFAFGLAAGDPIKAITVHHGTPVLWQGLAVLVVLLAGGFTG